MLPSAGVESFFLWGPRQVGKTTLLQQAYPEGGNTWIDLLDNEQLPQNSASGCELGAQAL